MSEETGAPPRRPLPTGVVVAVFVVLGIVILGYSAYQLKKFRQAQAERAFETAKEKPQGVVLEPASRRGELYQVLVHEYEHDPEHDRNLPTPPHVETPAEPTLVLVVFDTVRSDHTSVCGYDRPTTPHLEKLVTQGAKAVCRAYSPGDWSFPSHASFFTGLAVHEHGAHYAFGDEVEGTERIGSSLRVYPLRSDVETLAETLTARGYETVLISDNALLGQGGLSRGFRMVGVRPSKLDRKQDWVAPTLRRILAREVSPDRPLFLVLNFTQAHDPWLGPAEDIHWPDMLEPQMAPESFRAVFMPTVLGQTPPELSGIVRQQLVDLYDYGVLREDQAFERSLAVLRQAGWLDGAFRMVVTADHGELLFEHGGWRHFFVYEGTTRVPFLYLTDGDVPKLPEPLSAMSAYFLLRDGALPQPPPRPHTISIPNPDFDIKHPWHQKIGVALWHGDDKLWWAGGEYLKTNAITDPGDDAPLPLGQHPLRAELEELVQAVEAARKQHRPDAPQDTELIEQLEALGYLKEESSD